MIVHVHMPINNQHDVKEAFIEHFIVFHQIQFS